MPDRYRVYIASDFGGGRRLYIATDDLKSAGPATVRVANGFTFTEHQEGDAWDTADGIAGSDQLIQVIVDEAWRVGVRPSGFSDIKNETAALREHLGDMKTVAFHLLKIKQG